MVSAHELDKLLRIPGRMIALESPDGAEVARSIGKLALMRGQACYLWSPSTGLTRQGNTKVCVPNTLAVEGTLHHIAECRHFAIFVLDGVGPALLNPTIIRLLHDLVDQSGAAPRKIIMIDDKLEIPIRLQPEIVRVRQRGRARSAVG